MSIPAFDGSEYRRTVLSQLRERDPAEEEDLFWLAHVPRDVDDAATIATRLRETKGFLNKERSRARQAAVALAVLKQWPRVEGVLGDPAARSALRQQLASAPRQTAPAPSTPRPRPVDPAARRRRQAASSLDELARLRGEPELAEDLFAFLGLPVTATKAMIQERLLRAGEVNRRRRPDRERTLVDELLDHARELLVHGDPQAYRTDLARDSVIDALLGGDADRARQALARARTLGISDAAVLAVLAAVGGGVVPLSDVGLGVWCPSCATANAAGAHVCSSCGATLSIVCTSCRTPLAADLASCPSCGASLDDAREQAALAQVEARAPPPPAPAQVTVVMADGEARLSWPRSDDPGVDAYLVERVQSGKRRGLGRTALTTWSDAQPPVADTTWTVRALRGESASAPTAAVRAGDAGSPAHGGSLAAVKAVAGLPVELSWRAPAGAQVMLVRIERRSDGDIQRQLSVDPRGYRDRQVGRGKRYEYRVSIAGSSEPPAVLELVAGSGATVHATAGAAARPSRRPAAAASAIDGVAAVRDADGRLRVTWRWPSGVTEAYVAVGARPPTQAGGQGRKVTNMRYELDNGALIDHVSAGAHVAVFAGRRDPAGVLTWDAAADRSRTVAP
jgi:hypothetical protein